MTAHSILIDEGADLLAACPSVSNMAVYQSNVNLSTILGHLYWSTSIVFTFYCLSVKATLSGGCQQLTFKYKFHFRFMALRLPTVTNF